ncbi:MAG: hypothetical protein GY869_30085, partial [Planctomycetes bacterium]|nr:hypothetical protein [Planctomycetota bacterium]
ITAVDNAGNASGYSNEVSETPVDETPPADPQNLNATAGDEQIDLDWEANGEPDLAKYRIYRDTFSPATTLVDSVVGAPPVALYSDTGLTNGQIYYYRITAVDNAGNASGYSNEVSETPVDTTPPSNPQNLAAMPGDQQITLNWDRNIEPDLHKYNIYRDTSSTPTTLVDSVVAASPPDTFFVDTGLTNGQIYYYRITAVDSAGNASGYSNEVSETPVDETPPADPQNLNATAGDEQIDLDWDANSEPDLTKYRIYRDTVSPATTLVDSVVGAPPVALYPDTGLINGQIYYYRITAVDNAGNASGYSNEVSETPVDTTPPADPQNPVAIPSNQQIYLYWDANSEPDLAKYRIYRDLSATATTLVDSVTGAPLDWAYIDNNVTNGTTYYYRITAVDSTGNVSSYSGEVSTAPVDAATGTDLVFSTFLGSSAVESCTDIKIDSLGNIYVVGTTYSSGFPTTSNSYDSTYNGGDSDGFVAKFNATGTHLIYSTFLGGSDEDVGKSIEIDSNGNVYVSGHTFSSNFPVSPDAVQNTLDGNNDIFVLKLNATGTAIEYSTFMGGSEDDTSYGIDIDN